jgi:hypothetical protein
VFGLIHDAHPAASEHGEQLVASELLADEWEDGAQRATGVVRSWCRRWRHPAPLSLPRETVLSSLLSIR